MAQITIGNRDFDVQILTETIQGAFQQKNAFIGSPLVSLGAVAVKGQMPAGDPAFIGNTITIPYFGTLGDFVDNPDGSAITPSALSLTNEKATVHRDSLAFEVSHWAQNSGPDDADPYQEAARQIVVAAGRAMDKHIMDSAATTPLVNDVYSTTTPQQFNYDLLADSRVKWGDEPDDVVGMVCHSRTVNDLRKQKDSMGRSLLVESQTLYDLPRFGGLPIIQSDRAPLTGSIIGSPVSTGTSPPVLTISGTPTGPWALKIVPVIGGAHGTATFRFSTDNGNTFSAPIATVSVGTVIALIDTTVDSLVGQNGKTGISVAFAAGTFNVDNVWTGTTLLKATTMLLKKGALAFWFNENALAPASLPNVLAHTNVTAMHLYYASYLYRRVRGGTRPGVVAIKHNIGGF